MLRRQNYDGVRQLRDRTVGLLQGDQQVRLRVPVCSVWLKSASAIGLHLALPRQGDSGRGGHRLRNPLVPKPNLARSAAPFLEATWPPVATRGFELLSRQKGRSGLVLLVFRVPRKTASCEIFEKYEGISQPPPSWTPSGMPPHRPADAPRRARAARRQSRSAERARRRWATACAASAGRWPLEHRTV
mgnify:CR=1 FL=1